MQRVLILGSGIAGLCCAKLLARQGWEVHLQGSRPQNAPTWVLNQITCGLLAEIWQLDTAFWDGGHCLSDRQVCWGQSGTIERVDQPSMVVRGNWLVEQLRSRLLTNHSEHVYLKESCPEADVPSSLNLGHSSQHPFDWILNARGRTAAIAPLGPVRTHCGHRYIISQEVTLNPDHNPHSCWLETVPDGWLFLAPLGEGQAVLQAMVPHQVFDPDLRLSNLLEQTRFIKSHIRRRFNDTSLFAASPQYLEPFCGPGWLAVGEAAFSVDPISGDGIGYAIRSAILAASILAGVASGLPIQDCLHHYSLRLHQTFEAHLRQCLQYYSSSFTSAAWQVELGRMQEVLNPFVAQRLQSESYQYQLQQFSLCARS